MTETLIPFLLLWCAHVDLSSLTRDPTSPSAKQAWDLNYWTTSEVPRHYLVKETGWRQGNFNKEASIFWLSVSEELTEVNRETLKLDLGGCGKLLSRNVLKNEKWIRERKNRNVKEKMKKLKSRHKIKCWGRLVHRLFHDRNSMRGFPGGSNGKEPACQCRVDVRDAGLIPGLGRSPGGGPNNPLQYSCL